jgi:hypothetical protein
MSTKVTRSSLISILPGSPIADSRPSGLSTTSSPADIRSIWTSPAGGPASPDTATDPGATRQTNESLISRLLSAGSQS